MFDTNMYIYTFPVRFNFHMGNYEFQKVLCSLGYVSMKYLQHRYNQSKMYSHCLFLVLIYSHPILKDS